MALKNFRISSHQNEDVIEKIKERVDVVTKLPKLGDSSLYRNYEFSVYCKKCTDKHIIKLTTEYDPGNIKFDY